MNEALDEMTVEQAREVLDRHRAAEDAKRAEDRRLEYQGNFYRYRNAGGGQDERWWVYGAVTSVSEGGRLEGWTFERYPNGKIEIDPDGWAINAVVMNGGEQITADEFWAAAEAVRNAAFTQLSRR